MGTGYTDNCYHLSCCNIMTLTTTLALNKCLSKIETNTVEPLIIVDTLGT